MDEVPACSGGERGDINGDGSVYVAYLPNSPTRHVFKEFKELRSFLDSPENRKLNTSKISSILSEHLE